MIVTRVKIHHFLVGIIALAMVITAAIVSTNNLNWIAYLTYGYGFVCAALYNAFIAYGVSFVKKPVAKMCHIFLLVEVQGRCLAQPSVLSLNVLSDYKQ